MLNSIKLVSDTVDKNDIAALTKWLNQDSIPKLTKGELTVEFEKKWAKKIGTKYSVFVNSGSSAILLTLAAIKHMTSKKLKVVVPALSWATDVSSPMILDMDIVMCDCNLTDLSCDLTNLKQIFETEKPDVLVLVSPLGLVPNMVELVELCKLHNVFLLEDVCESLGSKHNNQYLGTFGYASFFSLYFGHHLSTIEGGFINTNDEELYHMLIMMRSHGWDRDLPKPKQLELRKLYNITNFDALYTFYVPGFNFRSTDLQAFIGLRSIDKLDDYSEKREHNFKLYNDKIQCNQLSISNNPTDFISNFAYPVVNSNRTEIIYNLEKHNIEVRPLIAGNMARKPMWTDKYNDLVTLPNADIINNFGFYLPNHQDLTINDINQVCEIVNKFGK
jgi:CDP-6-deoxy-D-xylo-4-hexulose-3-dehydrase